MSIFMFVRRHWQNFDFETSARDEESGRSRVTGWPVHRSYLCQHVSFVGTAQRGLTVLFGVSKLPSVTGCACACTCMCVFGCSASVQCIGTLASVS